MRAPSQFAPPQLSLPRQRVPCAPRRAARGDRGGRCLLGRTRVDLLDGLRAGAQLLADLLRIRQKVRLHLLNCAVVKFIPLGQLLSFRLICVRHLAQLVAHALGRLPRLPCFCKGRDERAHDLLLLFMLLSQQFHLPIELLDGRACARRFLFPDHRICVHLHLKLSALADLLIQLLIRHPKAGLKCHLQRIALVSQVAILPRRHINQPLELSYALDQHGGAGLAITTRGRRRVDLPGWRRAVSAAVVAAAPGVAPQASLACGCTRSASAARDHPRSQPAAAAAGCLATCPALASLAEHCSHSRTAALGSPGQRPGAGTHAHRPATTARGPPAPQGSPPWGSHLWRRGVRGQLPRGVVGRACGRSLNDRRRAHIAWVVPREEALWRRSDARAIVSLASTVRLELRTQRVEVLLVLLGEAVPALLVLAEVGEHARRLVDARTRVESEM
eukprot:scaffold93823_cov26-Tisochrysis_lutea.AAC.4